MGKFKEKILNFEGPWCLGSDFNTKRNADERIRKEDIGALWQLLIISSMRLDFWIFLYQDKNTHGVVIEMI